MERKRILVLAPQVPWPPTQGAALRNFQIISTLARRHAVTLLAFGDPDAPPGPLEQMGIEVAAIPPPSPRSQLRRALELFTHPLPDLARRLHSETLLVSARLRTLITEPFDVLLVEGLEMAPYALSVLAPMPAATRPRLVFDAHNAEWLLQRRALEADSLRVRRWPAAFYSLVQTVKLKRFEARVMRAAETTVAVSAADAASLSALAPEAHIVVAPNGVDTQRFAPGPPRQEDPDLIVFVGKMDFRPNVDAAVWFCREVWPLVRAARPAARLALVGRDPVAAVAALAQVPGVTVTGFVDDVRPWLSRAGVVVAPLRVGGGTRIKILEAMAMEKAVVATTLAVEGLDVVAGSELVLADDAAAMAHALTELASDPPRRSALGEAARRKVEFAYRWETTGWRLEALARGGGEDVTASIPVVVAPP